MNKPISEPSLPRAAVLGIPIAAAESSRCRAAVLPPAPPKTGNKGIPFLP